LSLLKSLFADYAYITDWKVLYTATVSSTIIGSSAIVFQINQLPYGGNCKVDLYSGIALSTYFTISCYNWIDPDGQVAMYEFYGKNK
jgi:hypothetical protein